MQIIDCVSVHHKMYIYIHLRINMNILLFALTGISCDLISQVECLRKAINMFSCNLVIEFYQVIKLYEYLIAKRSDSKFYLEKLGVWGSF